MFIQLKIDFLGVSHHIKQCEQGTKAFMFFHKIKSDII
jgi:hypothetical protein